jgi:hypothetical protein
MLCALGASGGAAAAFFFAGVLDGIAPELAIATIMFVFWATRIASRRLRA